MARIGISITKEVAFRDNTQEFSNVYYYSNGGGGLPDEAGAEALIDELVALEKTWHATVVTFTHARCWSQVGSPAANNMIKEKTLSGTGAQTANTSLDRERAYLLQYEAGFDSRGHRVYLRKWYHSCGIFDAAQASLSTGILGNTTGFSTSDRTVISNKADNILVLGSAGGGWLLCAKSGRATTSSGPGAHKYLEHHQLGDQWRG